MRVRCRSLADLKLLVVINVNLTFVQSYLVFNNVLKWLDVHFICTSFVERFLNVLIRMGETSVVSESSVKS